MNLFDNIFGNPINTFLSEKTPTKKVMSYEKPGYAESVNTSANSPTQGFLYKALSPYEQTAENVTGALQDTAKMYQGVSQDITQGAQNIASNPGLEALGRSWKKKYPDTAKFDDATVGKSVLEKYPEYQYYVDSKQTLLGQGAKVLGGIGSMFASAPGMVAGGTEQLGTGLGTIASAQSGQDVAEGALQAGKGALQAGFGVATGAMPFSSTVLGGISGTDTGGKVLGKLSEYGGIAGQKTAQFLGGNEAVQKQAQGLGEIAGPILALKGISKGGKIVKPLVKPAIIKTGEVAKGAVKLAQKIPNPLPKGANISTRANRFTAGDEGKFIAQIKEAPGEFATSRGMTEVGEKAIEKAQKNFERSKAEADIGFDTIQGKFSTKGASNDIVGDLLKANKEKMNAQPRNKDSAKVDELLRKYESGEGLTMSEINEAKRIHARNHTYSYEQRTSNEARNASDIQNDIRDWQFQTAKENGFTNADKINMETKGWKMYADSLAKKMDRSGANNAIGITDWIALSGGNPANVALFLGKKAASSNLIKTGAIKLFSKKTKPSIIEASKADIQQANFEKNVNRGISGDMNSAGGKSMVKPRALLPAPTGKATGARNFRANQPMEKSPIKNDKQVGERQVKKEAQKLLPSGEGKSQSANVVNVKPVILPKKQSATMGDMETKKLIEEAKSLGKYDNSYDVLKGKKLYRGGNEDGVFWTDDIDIAKSFGDEGVIEKTITIKNPLDVRSKGIKDYIKKNTNINIDDATSAYSRNLPEFKKLMKWAKENGYDGIIGKTSDNGLNFTGNEFVYLK